MSSLRLLVVPTFVWLDAVIAALATFRALHNGYRVDAEGRNTYVHEGYVYC
jgi:hypothetical protein